MQKPKYTNIAQMETAAKGEADNTVSMRLRYPSHFSGNSAWLEVVYDTGVARNYSYWLTQHKSKAINQQQAQALIDLEWSAI